MTVGVSNSRPLYTVICELLLPDVGIGEQVTDPPGASSAPTWTTRFKRKFLALSLQAEAGGVIGRTAFTGLLISRPVYESTHFGTALGLEQGEEAGSTKIRSCLKPTHRPGT